VHRVSPLTCPCRHVDGEKGAEHSLTPSHSHSPRSASLSPSPCPSEAAACRAIAADLRQACTPPPPHLHPIHHVHSFVVSHSTSPTRHCLSSNQGKGLRAVAVAAIAAVRRQAPSSPVDSPIHRSSYLLLRWSIVALGRRCSRRSLVHHYRCHLVGTCDCTTRTHHGRELQLAAADLS